jgi:hypothetical protein
MYAVTKNLPPLSFFKFLLPQNYVSSFSLEHKPKGSNYNLCLSKAFYTSSDFTDTCCVYYTQ